MCHVTHKPRMLKAAMQDPTFLTAPWRKFYHHAWWDGLWFLLADANWMQWTLWRLQCKTQLVPLRRDESFVSMPGERPEDNGSATPHAHKQFVHGHVALASRRQFHRACLLTWSEMATDMIGSLRFFAWKTNDMLGSLRFFTWSTNFLCVT